MIRQEIRHSIEGDFLHDLSVFIAERHYALQRPRVELWSPERRDTFRFQIAGCSSIHREDEYADLAAVVLPSWASMRALAWANFKGFEYRTYPSLSFKTRSIVLMPSLGFPDDQWVRAILLRGPERPGREEGSTGVCALHRQVARGCRTGPGLRPVLYARALPGGSRRGRTSQAP
jgi:hypothetical protein